MASSTGFRSYVWGRGSGPPASEIAGIITTGGAAEESFAAVSDFPAPTAVAAGATCVTGAKTAKGSSCWVVSGFPRRNRGRLGSPIGSSSVDAEVVDAEVLGAEAGAALGCSGGDVFAVCAGAGAEAGALAGALGFGAGAVEGAGVPCGAGEDAVVDFGWSLLAA